MDLIVSTGAEAVDACPAELCEHKGDGHPDSLCDGVAEAVSQALCRAYLDAFGEVRHHNVDKALLVGGRSRPRFGGGAVETPMRLIVAGCADPLPARDEVTELGRAAARAYLARCLRRAPERIDIEMAIRPGAAQLRGTLAAGVPLANDTSFGAAHAPYSRLEQAVLRLSALLRGEEFRRAFPAAGDDFKVMGRRIGERMGMTVALAFVDREVAGVDAYFAQKAAMEDWLGERGAPGCAIRINTLDAQRAGGEDDLYLTVTGTSAEHADDGQVGRGNRVNGLITPMRTMSLEAAAGKNPVSHVGKIYNVLALEMARSIAAQLPGLREVAVQLLSAIGRPVNRPLLVALGCCLDGAGHGPPDRARLLSIVRGHLDGIPSLSMRLARGEVRVF